MSWQSVLLSLLSGITDPAERLDIARTVMFLLQAYEDGMMDEETLKAELIGLFKDVITAKYPELTEEEALERARQMANEVIAKYKLQTSFRRITKKYRIGRGAV